MKIDTEAKAYFLGALFNQLNDIVKSSNKTQLLHLDYCTGEAYLSVKDSLPIGLKPQKDLSLLVQKDLLIPYLKEELSLNLEGDFALFSFPKLENEKMNLHFIRGIFDKNGEISFYGEDFYYREPNATLSKFSNSFFMKLLEIVEAPATSYFNKSGEPSLRWRGNNCLDFLDKIYSNAKYASLKNLTNFEKLASWIPSLSSSDFYGKETHFEWAKTLPEAVPPSKSRASDSGYDLTLIKKDKTIGMVQMYDTGIKVKPEYGWFFYAIPRSSVIKSGYILANSVGVIDRTYTGSIKVPLIKIDPDAPELTLPNRLIQLVPSPIVHMISKERDDLDTTARAEGGFGSTNKG